MPNARNMNFSYTGSELPRFIVGRVGEAVLVPGAPGCSGRCWAMSATLTRFGFVERMAQERARTTRSPIQGFTSSANSSAARWRSGSPARRNCSAPSARRVARRAEEECPGAAGREHQE